MKSKFLAISLSPNLIAIPKFEQLLQFHPWFLICSIEPLDSYQTFNFLYFGL